MEMLTSGNSLVAHGDFGSAREEIPGAASLERYNGYIGVARIDDTRILT